MISYENAHIGPYRRRIRRPDFVVIAMFRRCWVQVLQWWCLCATRRFAYLNINNVYQGLKTQMYLEPCRCRCDGHPRIGFVFLVMVLVYHKL